MTRRRTVRERIRANGLRRSMALRRWLRAGNPTWSPELGLWYTIHGESDGPQPGPEYEDRLRARMDEMRVAQAHAVPQGALLVDAGDVQLPEQAHVVP